MFVVYRRRHNIIAHSPTSPSVNWFLLASLHCLVVAFNDIFCPTHSSVTHSLSLCHSVSLFFSFSLCLSVCLSLLSLSLIHSLHPSIYFTSLNRFDHSWNNSPRLRRSSLGRSVSVVVKMLLSPIIIP